jgi:hypothetical protein
MGHCDSSMVSWNSKRDHWYLEQISHTWACAQRAEQYVNGRLPTAFSTGLAYVAQVRIQDQSTKRTPSSHLPQVSCGHRRFDRCIVNLSSLHVNSHGILKHIECLPAHKSCHKSMGNQTAPAHVQQPAGLDFGTGRGQIPSRVPQRAAQGLYI